MTRLAAALLLLALLATPAWSSNSNGYVTTAGCYLSRTAKEPTMCCVVDDNTGQSRILCGHFYQCPEGWDFKIGKLDPTKPTKDYCQPPNWR